MIYRELADSVKHATGMVVVSIGGLTVKETEDLRKKLHAGGVRLRLVRNRLAKRAFAERGLTPSQDLLAGNVAIAAGDTEQAIHAAKVFTQSELKKLGKIAIRGGMLEGSLIGAKETDAMASLPGRNELRATLLGLLSGPARALVTLLNALPGGTARVLQARVDQGDGGGAAPQNETS